MRQQVTLWRGSNNAVELVNFNDDETALPTIDTPVPAPITDAAVTFTVWATPPEYAPDGSIVAEGVPFPALDHLPLTHVADATYTVVVFSGAVFPLGSWDGVIEAEYTHGGQPRRRVFDLLVTVP